jgi:hypothetical protein
LAWKGGRKQGGQVQHGEHAEKRGFVPKNYIAPTLPLFYDIIEIINE